MRSLADGPNAIGHVFSQWSTLNITTFKWDAKDHFRIFQLIYPRMWSFSFLLDTLVPDVITGERESDTTQRVASVIKNKLILGGFWNY